jgi:hypothetical protein
VLSPSSLGQMEKRLAQKKGNKTKTRGSARKRVAMAGIYQQTLENWLIKV